MTANGIKETFAGNLRSRMGYLNMKQDMLSASTGISAGAICNYFNGRAMPNSEALIVIARALGTDPNTLIGWDSIKSKQGEGADHEPNV